MAHNAVVRTLLKSGYAPDCIFDVGANAGLTVGEFAENFPDATIYAFEPVTAAFELLTSRVTVHSKVQCNRLALGRAAAQVTMAVAGASPGNRVLNPGIAAKGETEIVEQTTGDTYCLARGIERIGFLKIDTEGRDLDVLLGFGRMVQANLIDFVQMECSLAPDNVLHVSLSSMQAVMFAMGYRMFGLFDVMPRKRSGLAGAFYGNAVYVRADLAWPPSPRSLPAARA